MKTGTFIWVIVVVAVTLFGAIWLVSRPPDALTQNPPSENIQKPLTPSVPTAADLAAAGQRTVDASGTSKLMWTATFKSAAAESSIVECTYERGILRQVLKTKAANGTEAVELVLIQSQDLWYVWNGRTREVYRAGEAPTVESFLSMVLSLAELTIFDTKDFVAVDGAEGEGVNVRVMKPEGRAFIEKALAYADAFPPEYLDENTSNGLGDIEKMRARGISVRLDGRTGVVVDRTVGKQLKIHYTPPVILPITGELEREISQSAWVDHTAPIYDPATANTLMQLELGLSYPNSEALTSVIFQPLTGEYRRIPLISWRIRLGCFSKDRRRVYVSAGIQGADGLYEVDLLTGQVRKMVPDTLIFSPNSWKPALSPDGRYLAVVSEVGKAWVTFVVDIENNSAREIGRGLEFANVSWTPDGNHLIGWLAPEAQEKVGKPGEWVVRMDLKGNITPIVEGKKPILLGDGEHIAYLHPVETRWQQCRLDGSQAEPLAGGLRGVLGIAPGPPGQGFITVQYPEGKLIPVLTPVNTDSGNWKAIPPFTASVQWR